MKNELYAFEQQDSHRAVERFLARENFHSTHYESNIDIVHEMVIPLLFDTLVFSGWFSYN